jgi:hypothetical protein
VENSLRSKRDVECGRQEGVETSDPVKELLNTQIPAKLWDYTSTFGLQGIVASKKIFATDIRFLNDREEFTHARKIADEIVQETDEFGPNDLPVRENLQKAVDLAFNTGSLHPDRGQVFVASFSLAEDQLSQWRGYSRGTSGVSLAFDLKALRPLPEIDTLVSFAPRVYELDSKKKLIRHALRHFMDEVSSYWNDLSDAGQRLNRKGVNRATQTEFTNLVTQGTPDFTNRLKTATAKTQADLLRLAALLKNASFKEEGEWRLVLPIFVAKEPRQHPRLFRAGNTTLVPYIEYPLTLNPDGSLPLTDLVLGPGSDANAVPATESFLRTEGVKLVPRESRVPYRPW